MDRSWRALSEGPGRRPVTAQLTSVAQGSGRNQGIELARVLAAFAIIWYHSKAPGSEISYSGLSVFLMLTMLFEAGSNWSRPVRIAKLARRLLIPWAFWFLVFGAINLARHKPLMPLDYSGGWVAGVLAGSSIHLWYIPFIFALIVILALIKRFVDRQMLFWLVVMATVVNLATVWQWEPWSRQVGYPLAQWTQASTAVLIGLLMGLHRSTRWGAHALAVALMMVAATWVLSSLPGVALPHLIAALVLLAALRWGHRIPTLTVMQTLANATFGIYLCHPIFLGAAKQLPIHVALRVTIAFVASAFFVVGYQSLRARLKQPTLPVA
ncbi:MAG TPA: hypothetical protein DD677_08680 [Stenotrophomonas sp.]|nr:hypothetical protein [Stenotrophomonas sp.]